MAVTNDKNAGASTTKWLTIVGLGEDGISGLGDSARQAISDAAHVFGGKRHLALVKSLIGGTMHAWTQPFDPSMAAVIPLRGQQVCVLATGDPMFYGVGVTLSRVVSAEETRVITAPSSFSLGAARLGWSLQDVETLSLHAAHTAALETLRRYLQPGRRILALTAGSSSPFEIAAYITKAGFGTSTLIVLEALGGANERISRHIARQLAAQEFHALNLVAIEVTPDSDETRIIPSAPGLPDDWFEHDGQITRREIRALTIAALQPRTGQRLWDIGAGAGSIAIEWMLSQARMQAIAIESNPARAHRIGRNALSLGVPSLEIIEGRAPEALAGLAAPDAIVVGGGGTHPGVMVASMAALRPGGRLVANAVTLEMESHLIGLSENLGGSLIRLALSKAEPLGAKRAFRPALAITQWSWTKETPGGQSAAAQSIESPSPEDQSLESQLPPGRES